MEATTKTSQPVEIAYRIPGIGWKRKICKTEAAMQKFIERLIEKEGNDIEIRWAV